MRCAERLLPYQGTLTDAVEHFIAYLDCTARSCTVNAYLRTSAA